MGKTGLWIPEKMASVLVAPLSAASTHCCGNPLQWSWGVVSFPVFYRLLEHFLPVTFSLVGVNAGFYSLTMASCNRYFVYLS